MKKKIVIVIGTRPEIIRFSPIIHCLMKSKKVDFSIIHTGQHYSDDMSDIFFQELKIPKPVLNLSVMESNPAKQVSEIVNKMSDAISETKPDLICVWGDTNSSLGAAIAANKLKTKLCHLEAGCRSHDFRMAEEYNRILIDHLSDLLFPVAACDMKNLLLEKVHGKKIFMGDPLYDAFLSNNFEAFKKPSKRLNQFKDCRILLTLHRAENVDDPKILKKILTSINRIKNFKIVFPIHPRTRKMIDIYGLNKFVDNEIIKTVSPLSYFEILNMLDRCKLVITDSGGLQKEAFFAKRMCITLRKSTEQLDTTRLKVNILIDPATNKIEKLPDICLSEKRINNLFNKMPEEPYGDGQASEKIINEIINEIQS